MQGSEHRHVHLSDGPVEGTFNLSSPLITKENAQSFYFEDSPY